MIEQSMTDAKGYATALLLALLLHAVAPADYVPSATKVALVPVVNASGESNLGGKAKQTARGDEELHALFEEHGFAVLPDDAIRQAVADLHVDLGDEEAQKRETLYQIGQRTGADLVAFVVITDVDQRKATHMFSTSTEGSAKMKLWIVDPKAQQAILSGKVVQGSSKSGGLMEVGEKGSLRKQLAVANGLRDSTKEFFKPYPVVKKVERSKVG